MAKNNKKGPKGKKPNVKKKELLSGEDGKEFNGNNISADLTDVITRFEELPPEKREAVIETLPPEKRKAVCSIRATQFSGPLPSSEEMQGYEQAHPGAADRILSMAEGEANHRRKMERKVVNLDTMEHVVGLIFGLVVALAGIGGGVWCVLAGQALAGSVLAGATIVSLVGVFVYGSRMKSIVVPPNAQLHQMLKAVGEDKDQKKG